MDAPGLALVLVWELLMLLWLSLCLALREVDSLTL